MSIKFALIYCLHANILWAYIMDSYLLVHLKYQSTIYDEVS